MCLWVAVPGQPHARLLNAEPGWLNRAHHLPGVGHRLQQLGQMALRIAVHGVVLQLQPQRILHQGIKPTKHETKQITNKLGAISRMHKQ